jgi:catechol 2,3-dioxygenase-like lactoylglutathione lyase family enzyme
MNVARKHIRLGVSDPARSAQFYQALLGATATRSAGDAGGAMVLESDSPPVVLVLEARLRPPHRTRRARSTVPAAHAVEPAARAPARHAAWASRSREAFDLLVSEPEHVGRAAVALWRAGARLRLEDAGIETHDPDGIAWRVRFVLGTKERAILTWPEDAEAGADHERR